MKTKWNLELLYSSYDDPRIEDDLVCYENECVLFEKKFKKNTDYLNVETRLHSALHAYEKLVEAIATPRPLFYFELSVALNSNDTRAQQELKKIMLRCTEAKSRIIFFELALGTIPQSQKQLLLKSKKLAHFRSFLKGVFDRSKHQLSEGEEKILNLTSIPGHVMWVNGQEKLISNQTVQYKGKSIPLAAALEKISSLPTSERRKLHNDSMKTLKSVAHFAESEINAIYTTKKINDELRGFKEPYSATLLDYQDSEETVLNLVKTISDRFDVSRRFYDLKAKLLYMPKLSYADRNVSIGKLKRTFSKDQSVNILRNAFAKIGERYLAIFDSFLCNGQIDFLPKKAKTKGAFCAGSINVPTYVLLNHENSIRSVTTIAHEMGHAFHTEFSKVQTPLYQGYGFSIAEVASTFFENFVYEELIPLLNEKEKIILLHDKLNDSIQTIFRQIAFFNFEFELHHLVRSHGGVSKEAIAELLNKHTQAYMGPAVSLQVSDGYYFTLISQIRRYFYVYSYAYGNVISQTLFKRYKDDKNYLSKIEQFLSAGCSATPQEIFSSIGVDITNPTFFEEGVSKIESDMAHLEELMR